MLEKWDENAVSLIIYLVSFAMEVKIWNNHDYFFISYVNENTYEKL